MGRDRDRLEPDGRGKISQAALLENKGMMVVCAHPLSWPAQHSPFPRKNTPGEAKWHRQLNNFEAQTDEIFWGIAPSVLLTCSELRMIFR